MLMSYAEAVKEYGSGYKLKKAVNLGEIYKLSPGIYARRSEIHHLIALNRSEGETRFIAIWH